MNEPLTPRMQMLLAAPIPTMLWRLSTPNVLAVMMMAAATIIDAWAVGQFGTAALASLALVFPFQSLMQMTAGGAIGGGITSAVARALGGNDAHGAQAAAWHGTLIALAMTTLYMIILGGFSEAIFTALGGSGEALSGAVQYAQIAFGGAVATWLMFTFSAILRGTGDTVTPARAVVVSSITQMCLSITLTLGIGPFPEMGITGPATAMVLCQGSSALYLGWHLLRGRALVALRIQALRWAPIANIMRVGGLGLINSASIALTVITVTGFVGQYGNAALAGYGLGNRLEFMLIPIAFGIGGALTAAVGSNFGAGQYARARRVALAGAAVTIATTGLIGIVVALFPNLWLDHFTTDPEVYAYGALYLMIVGPFYGLFGGGQTLYFASQGTGKMGWPVTVGVLRFCIVATIGALAVALSWQMSAVFAAVSIGLAVVGLGLGLCMRSRAWCPEKS